MMPNYKKPMPHQSSQPIQIGQRLKSYHLLYTERLPPQNRALRVQHLTNMLSEKENIAIAELAVYIPSIILAMAIIFRHGFSKGRPWIYLILFCGLRIASAALEILSADNPTSREDATWAAILGSIGLSPFFLVASGLLSRV